MLRNYQSSSRKLRDTTWFSVPPQTEVHVYRAKILLITRILIRPVVDRPGDGFDRVLALTRSFGDSHGPGADCGGGDGDGTLSLPLERGVLRRD